VQLGAAKSTLKEWLERGRQLLGARLVRRGLAPPAVLVATAWPAPICSASLALSVVSATVKAAGQSVAGQATAGALSANVATLTERVLKMMLLTKLKTATAGVVLLVALAGGSGLIYQTTMAMDPGQRAGPPPKQADDPASKTPPVPKSLEKAEADVKEARAEVVEAERIAEQARAQAERAKSEAQRAIDKLEQAEARLGSLRNSGQGGDGTGSEEQGNGGGGVSRTVTLNDGTRMPLDPTGLLITKELRGRFVVGWDGPLTVAESDGPIGVRLRDKPLTLDLRTVAGERQAVVRVRAVGRDALVELRLRRTTGKYPVRLELQPAQSNRDAEVEAGDKAVKLALWLSASASEIEVEAIKGAVATRVIQAPSR
jgi:hypothetical protein